MLGKGGCPCIRTASSMGGIHRRRNVIINKQWKPCRSYHHRSSLKHCFLEASNVLLCAKVPPSSFSLVYALHYLTFNRIKCISHQATGLQALQFNQSLGAFPVAAAVWPSQRLQGACRSLENVSRARMCERRTSRPSVP